MSKPATPLKIRRRSSAFGNRLLVAALIVAGTMTMSASMKADTTMPASVSAIKADAGTPSAPTIQLADEIIRRLRRLGLNFNRARIQRPYDPEGELC